MKFFIVSLFLSVISFSTFAAKENYGSWSYECDKGVCTTNQLLFAQKGTQGGVVGGLTLMPLPNKQTLLTVRVSQNADQKNGIGIKIDENKAIRVPLKKCNEQVCEANVIADEVLLAEMNKGKVMGVFFINASNQKQVSLPFSLAGFKPAFQRLLAQ